MSRHTNVKIQSPQTCFPQELRKAHPARKEQRGETGLGQPVIPVFGRGGGEKGEAGGKGKASLQPEVRNQFSPVLCSGEK